MVPSLRGKDASLKGVKKEGDPLDETEKEDKVKDVKASSDPGKLEPQEKDQERVCQETSHGESFRRKVRLTKVSNSVEGKQDEV